MKQGMTHEAAINAMRQVLEYLKSVDHLEKQDELPLCLNPRFNGRNPYKACDEISKASNLTPREEEVFTLRMCGYEKKQIAWKLSISDNTVNNHCKAIYVKTECHSYDQLVEQVRLQMELSEK